MEDIVTVFGSTYIHGKKVAIYIKFRYVLSANNTSSGAGKPLSNHFSNHSFLKARRSEEAPTYAKETSRKCSCNHSLLDSFIHTKFSATKECLCIHFYSFGIMCSCFCIHMRMPSITLVHISKSTALVPLNSRAILSCLT